MNIIHNDVVEIWNLYDKCRVSSLQLLCCLTAQYNQYLSSNRFKIDMSHIVKDLAVPDGGALPR